MKRIRSSAQMAEKRHSEKGAALLLAMVVAVLLAVMALTLTSSSIDQVGSSADFEAHEKALIAADSGLMAVKDYLKKKDLSTELARTAQVPVYLSSSDPPADSYAARNPILLLDARNVNFDAPPSPARYRSVAGSPFSPLGVAIGSSRYFAKITDNKDEPLSLLNDPLVDQDDRVIVRVIGVSKGSHAQVATYGNARKNAVSVVEGVLKRDYTLFPESALLVYGPNAVATFNGNAFSIDGHDHTGMTADQINRFHVDTGRQPYMALGTVNDDPLNGDGAQSATSLYDSLARQQRDNLTGAPGDFGLTPSLGDVTDQIRNSPAPEAQNVFSADYWAELVNRSLPIADQVISSSTTLNSATLGTTAAPRLTIARDNLTLSGTTSGAGLLIVQGAFSVAGTFEFDGLIVALGGNFQLSGTQKIRGGLFLSKLQDDGSGNRTLGVTATDITLNGASYIYYASDRVRMGLGLLPMIIESWREVTSDIEPAG